MWSREITGRQVSLQIRRNTLWIMQVRVFQKTNRLQFVERKIARMCIPANLLPKSKERAHLNLLGGISLKVVEKLLQQRSIYYNATFSPVSAKKMRQKHCGRQKPVGSKGISNPWKKDVCFATSWFDYKQDIRLHGLWRIAGWKLLLPFWSLNTERGNLIKPFHLR